MFQRRKSSIPTEIPVISTPKQKSISEHSFSNPSVDEFLMRIQRDKPTQREINEHSTADIRRQGRPRKNSEEYGREKGLQALEKRRKREDKNPIQRYST